MTKLFPKRQKPTMHRCERAAEEAQKLRDREKWRAWYHTPRWRALRAAQLLREPFCWLCMKRGVIRYATVCNHAKPHRGDPHKFWNGPFNSMCKPCHDCDQQRVEHGGIVRKQPDAHGWPE